MGDEASKFVDSRGHSGFGYKAARTDSSKVGHGAATNTSGAVQLRDWVDGGDWACSYGQTGTLRHICKQLAPTLDDEQASQARQVVLWLETDLLKATGIWSDLARDLRENALYRIG